MLCKHDKSNLSVIKLLALYVDKTDLIYLAVFLKGFMYAFP